MDRLPVLRADRPPDGVGEGEAGQRPRIVAQADALKAVLASPNDRLQIINAVVYQYDAGGANDKGTALFAALLATWKAKLAAKPDALLEGEFGSVLTERVHQLWYRKAEGERLAMLAELDAFVKAHPGARPCAVHAWRQYRLLNNRAKADEWYGLIHRWELDAYGAEQDAVKRAALLASLEEHMLERIDELRHFKDAAGKRRC